MKKEESKSKKIINKYKNHLKKNNIDFNKIEEELKSKDNMNLRDLINLAIEYVKEAFFPKKTNNFTLNNRLLILLLITCVASLNYYLEYVILLPLLAPLVGTKLAMTLAAATIAPIVEETYKLVTIKLGQPEFGFVALSFAEAFSYIHNLYKAMNPIELIGFALFRLFGTVFHLLTMRTMMDTRVKSMRKKFSLAVIMHACINGFESVFLSIFSNNYIIQILGDLTFTSQLMTWANMKLNKLKHKEASEDSTTQISEPIPQPA